MRSFAARTAAAAATMLLVAGSARAEPLALDDAIRTAWANNEGLHASAHDSSAARLDAEAARDRRLPSLSLSAQALRTDEPVAAFGLRLDQARITAPDFDPARLGHPDAIGGYRFRATVTQVLYAGGRVTAGGRAASAQSDAAAADHERRRQELALGVTEAYFGAQVAAATIRHADDVLAHARETERFVQVRVREGALLESELLRATAFRAQAEAEVATARQRLASARSGLALLVGSAAADAELPTPIVVPTSAPATPAATVRPDVAAARSRTEAAREGVTVARGALLPEVFAQASAEGMRSSGLGDGTTWTTLVVGVRWQLGVPDVRTLAAARAREAAADAAARWQERQASREVDEARRAIETADARVRSATESVAASESARSIREARHRQGLLPLTEVLDAEAGLAGARALLLSSRFEARLSRARLQLALGQPVEGVKP